MAFPLSFVRSLGPGLTLALLTACGGSDDEPAAEKSGLAGVYALTSRTESAPCTATAMPLALDPPYFEIADDNFFGSLIVNAYPCTGPDASTCDENAFPLILSVGKEGGGFHGEATSKGGSDDSCLVVWTGSDVTKTAEGVTLREEQHSGDWTGAACAGEVTDAQITMAKALPCESVETWVGTKP